MIRSMIVTLISLAVTASVYAGVGGGGDDSATGLGSPLDAPVLAMIGAVGLIAGIRYLRNKRS